MKSIYFKLLFGYVPLFVTVLFLYLPGLIDFCTNLGSPDPADAGEGDGRAYRIAAERYNFREINPCGV